MNMLSEITAPVLPSTLCYLNGTYSPLCDAKVSVLDRGFIFGDGVYEVLPAYNGKIFRFEQHMARLDRSLRELRIANPLPPEEWLNIARRLIKDLAESTGVANQLVYIQVTRGVAVRDHVMLPGLKPTVFVMVGEMKLASAAQRELGVACVSADDFRWQKAHIKSTSLLGAVFSRQISADAGALETIMFRDGWLSEAAASNVWVVKDGVVMGPPKDNLVLEGIRFGLIERICRADGIPFELRPIGRAEVLAADELLLSSATKEVLPITQLDG
jgi:D-alanine transaminase